MLVEFVADLADQVLQPLDAVQRHLKTALLEQELLL